MTEILNSATLRMHFFSWHEEDGVVIIRKKNRDALLLNPTSSALWKIMQNGWTVGAYKAAVGQKMELSGQQLEKIVEDFLTMMMREGVVATKNISLFEDS
jgi:hypothetical protein